MINWPIILMTGSLP